MTARSSRPDPPPRPLPKWIITAGALVALAVEVLVVAVICFILMKSFLNEILLYFALHPEIAGGAAAVSAFAALIALVLNLWQLRGAKLNRKVALLQLEVTKEQAITARNQANLSYETIDQQKRAARIAEEVKLDNQAPDLAIIEYGLAKCAVCDDKQSNASNYDWIFSEENDSVLPERFSIAPGSDYQWWELWVTGSLLLRNEGSRTVVLGPGLTFRWVGDIPLKSGNSQYIFSPGDEFRLEWFHSYSLESLRCDALDLRGDARKAENTDVLGVDRQRDNKLMVQSVHIPKLYDLCSITYTWNPLCKVFRGNDDEYSFVGRPPEIVIERKRYYPPPSED